ncbi:MAG: DNRLRE domain-containing protein, partial [Saprospiraceae bacterium]|nr:DNRLRE domain-containing protein [Saprospiraceae bacterium]
MKNELPTILTFFLTMILSVGPFDLSAQTTVTLESVKDNTIYLDPGGTLLSNGSGEHFFAGMSGSGLTHRALIQFDIAGSIPDNAQIESVVLTLNRSRAAPQSDGKSVTLHRLVSNWGEGSSMAPSGEGQGAPPANNDATWEHTFFDGSFWNNEGGDFMASQSASRTMQGSTIQWGSTGGMVQDVQDWLDNPSANFGWILLGDESQTSTSSRFDSK